MRLHLLPSDSLTFLFLALIGCLAVYSAPVNPAWSGLLGTCVLLATAVAAGAAYRTKARPASRGLYLSVAAATATVLLIFNALGELIASLRPTTCDNFLISADLAIFGCHPTVWMERLITPTLTTLLQLAYLSYYAIPLALGLLLIWRGRFEEFEEVLFGILLCFYLSYLCYLLVPAIGPRFTLSQYQSTGLQLPPFLAHLRDALNGLEKNKTDAFPSGHTAVSVLTLYYAWEKGEKVLFAVLMPLSMALIISTVYLRYHYVVDVLGGLALTGITIALAPGLALLFKGEPLPWRNR